MTEKIESFEKDVEKLEGMVSALEAGELSLDQAISHFEKGTKLAAKLEGLLAEAETKIEELKKSLSDVS